MCNINGCDEPVTHTTEGFIVPIGLCCEHAQRRLDVVEQQVGILQQELEDHGLTRYGQQLAMQGVHLKAKDDGAWPKED